jgi:hypothetical protein
MEEQNFVEISNMETIIVLKENSPSSLLISDPMVKAQWVRNRMICDVLRVNNIQQLEDDVNLGKRKKWIEEGLDCEILKLGESSWKKGKVRVKMTIEFCPDEPELPVYQSPLDEIYREIQGLQ